MHVVNGHESNNVSRSKSESMFEKEGNVKKNKVCLTNLLVDNSSYLCPHESERVTIARKASQTLGTHSARDFKSTIRMNLTRNKK